jgi:hypothetical protein
MAQASRPRGFSAILDADSVLWGIAIALAWTLLIAPLALMAVMLVVAAADVDLFHSLIDEDHPIEWAQFFAIAAAAVAFAIAAVRARRHDRRRLMALYLLVAFACFVVAGEEISWGQRIFHWGTPVVLEEANHQGEANIHNIGVVQRLFNLGELVAGLYGAALPILWAVPRIRARLTGLDSILVPPICLVTLFVLPFAYRTIRLILLPEVGERATELGEVPELTFYVGVLVVGIATARVLGRRRSLES